MSPTRKPIARRTFLRGAGAPLALPWLEAMATAGRPRPPVRVAVLYFPNGVHVPNWVPRESGLDYQLPFSLTPLGPVMDDVTVLSGLDKAASRQGDGHYAKTANFLTGLPIVKTTGREISVGSMSMDQLAAQQLGDMTPLPSLELGIDPVISGVDSNVGFTRLYGSYISWRSAHVPVAREINPRYVYERLFGLKTSPGMAPGIAAGNAGGPGRGRTLAEDQLLLDIVLEDAKALRGRLGRDDQFKLDEYMDSVRAVEKRIEFAAAADPREWHPEESPEPTAPPAPGVPRSYREHLRLMLDLMVMAFQTDSTRIVTFMLANAVSGRNFSFIDGVHGGHHDMSHHENKAEKIEQYRLINRWHVEQFAALLGRMRAIREGDSTLLDNSMILFGSGLSDGNSHNPNNLPILLGGHGGGALRTGHHLASPKNTPLCNLHLTMLRAMGARVEAFGDSTGVLPDLLS